MRLKWNNIKKDQCPRCNSGLDIDDRGANCKNPNCDLFITKNRLHELKNEMNRNDRAEEELEGYGIT